MTPRGWFILVLRGLGVWQAIDVVEYAATTYSAYIGIFHPRETSLQFYLLTVGIHLFLAVWLLYFAPATARVFYPDDRPR